MRLVLDTNIVVSGLLWSGNPQRILDLADDRRVKLYTSRPLIDELARVVDRPRFRLKLRRHRKTPLQLAARYALANRFVALRSSPRVVPSDPDDDAVVATAVAAAADLIVTGDGDLLALHPYQGIQILNAADAVRALSETLGT